MTSATVSPSPAQEVDDVLGAERVLARARAQAYHRLVGVEAAEAGLAAYRVAVRRERACLR